MDTAQELIAINQQIARLEYNDAALPLDQRREWRAAWLAAVNATSDLVTLATEMRE